MTGDFHVTHNANDLCHELRTPVLDELGQFSRGHIAGSSDWKVEVSHIPLSLSAFLWLSEKFKKLKKLKNSLFRVGLLLHVFIALQTCCFDTVTAFSVALGYFLGLFLLGNTFNFACVSFTPCKWYKVLPEMMLAPLWAPASFCLALHCFLLIPVQKRKSCK